MDEFRAREAALSSSLGAMQPALGAAPGALAEIQRDLEDERAHSAALEVRRHFCPHVSNSPSYC